MECKRVQKRAVLRHGRAHNGRVERMRHRDLHRLNTHGGKHGYGVVNGFAGPGNDRLRGAVFVGHGHITANACKLRLYFFHRGGNRGHFAVVFYADFAHHFATRADGFEAVFKIKNAGGYSGRVFAQAVAHHHVWLNAKGREQTHHGNIGREYGGLGHFGFLNGGLAHGNLLFGFAGFAPQRFG